MIDGEGTIAFYPPRYTARRVEVCNTEREVIDSCAEACDLLGYHYHVRTYDREHWKTIHYLVITGGLTLIAMADDLHLMHPSKRDLLAALADTYRPHVGSSDGRRAPKL